MSKRMKCPGLALAGAAVLAALSLTGLTPVSAKSTPLFISTWADVPSVLSGGHLECLGALGGNMTDGTPVVTWACNGHPDQKWEVDGIPGTGLTQIRNAKDPGMCLGVLAAATSNGANLVIWECNRSLDQEWSFSPFNSGIVNGPAGCFTVFNVNAPAKVLGVLGGNPADGAQAVLWDSLAGAAHFDQAWCPR
jgi:hypothetical protein